MHSNMEYVVKPDWDRLVKFICTVFTNQQIIFFYSGDDWFIYILSNSYILVKT